MKNDKAEQPAQDQSQSCFCLNCDALSKQVTALKTCLEVERGFKEQAQLVQQEPVAWMHPDGRIWTFGRGLDKSTFTIPLYTSPPASKPLTDQQIVDLCDGTLTTWEQVRIARAIEAAHGIKGDT